jgi:hypothetical protein
MAHYQCLVVIFTDYISYTVLVLHTGSRVLHVMLNVMMHIILDSQSKVSLSHAYMLRPLKTFGPPSSASTISNTLLEALGSVKAATQTSATKSREISPADSVSSPETTSAPVGGLAFKPPGRTMVYSIESK